MEKLPPHPSRPFAFALMGIGGVASVYGIVVAVPALPILGGTLALLGAYQWRMGIAATTANTAAAAINSGDLDRARALVAMARAQHRLTYVHRLLDSHESEIAWRDGDLEAARRALDVGRARRDAIPVGAWRGHHIVHLDALLALVRAMLGDDRGAEETIERVRNAESAQPGPLARVELAHAMLLARRGDLNALHTHLMRQHVLLSEGLEARGRALHRVLRRMTATRASSAYRLPAKNTAGKPGRSASWIARVFPGGAEHVELDEDVAVAPVFVAPNHAPAPPAPSAPVARKSRSLRVVILWVVLVVAFAAIYTLLRDPEGPGTPIALAPIFGILLIVFFGVLALNVARARRGTRTLEEAQRALICGELDRAESLARSLRDGNNRVLAANASLILSSVLERRADFAGALAECDRGIGQLTGLMKMGTSDVLLPQMIASRAYLFGTLGRDADSDGELARLARDYPAFPYAAGMVLRTRLVRAAKNGDLPLARELAMARGDVSVGAYAELVAELVLAVDAEDREERVASVREDLAALPDADRWLRSIAPALMTPTLGK